MISKTKYSILFILFFFLPLRLLAGGLDTSMDNIFNEMSNYTAPGRYETQGRLAYSGGGYSFRSRIYNENLVSMQLPSARGGCNGIDAFGGSFSFVDSDRIEALFKQIASNAKGYLFSIAVANVCPSCQTWMNELQNKIMALNNHFSNSCQMAQGIVNLGVDSIPGLNVKGQTDANLTQMVTGFKKDFSAAAAHIGDPKTAFENLWAGNDQPGPLNGRSNDLIGSVGWNALIKNNAASWFPGGDDLLLEQLISITGHVVVGDLVDSDPTAFSDASTGVSYGGKNPKITVLPPLQDINLRTLIQGSGSKVRIYDCSKDEKFKKCAINGETKEVALTGLKQKIQTALLSDKGLLYKLKNKTYTDALEQSQQNLLAALPANIGQKINLMGAMSPEATEEFISNSLDAITLEYVYRLLIQNIDAMDAAMKNFNTTYVETQKNQVSEARKRIEVEHSQLRNEFGRVQDIEVYFSHLISLLPKANYVNLSQTSKHSNNQ